MTLKTYILTYKTMISHKILGIIYFDPFICDSGPLCGKWLCPESFKTFFFYQLDFCPSIRYKFSNQFELNFPIRDLKF